MGFVRRAAKGVVHVQAVLSLVVAGAVVSLEVAVGSSNSIVVVVVEMELV